MLPDCLGEFTIPVTTELAYTHIQLILKHMAKNSFPLFVNEVLLPGTPEPHKTQALQVVFDLILAYGGDLLLDHSRGVSILLLHSIDCF